MRVAALGHLYDASVVTDHVSQIALHTYLGRIVRQSSTARDRGGPAPFTADLEEMYVPMGTAVPLGLLTAELLTGLRKSSALCPEGPGLRIELITAGHTTGRLSVACPATASGVPAGVTHEVVHALADQIGATIRRHGNPDGGEPVRIDVLFPRGEAGSQSGVGVREN
jgi:two-component sensor histidine kinase